jgi:ABC-type phosphonate transport system ATPase subunit
MSDLSDSIDSLGQTEVLIQENLEQRDIARKAAGLVQDNLAAKLSGIVTKAISTVFEEPIEFVVQFVERRGVSECDLSLKIGEDYYDILNEQGGGVADVCSMCLQMAFIMMSQVNRVLVIDEPARHMDVAAQERFIAVLKQLCQELKFTVIMVTHSQAFSDNADKIFTITKKGGVSYVNN